MIHRLFTFVDKFPTSTKQFISPALVSSNRSFWQESVKSTVLSDGKVSYQDPSVAQEQMNRAERKEGNMFRSKRYQYYEKPWMKTQRLKNEIPRKRELKRIKELTTWIEWRRSHKLPIL